MQALCFVSTLSDIQSVPLGTVVAYQDAIVKAYLFHISEDLLSELLSSSLEFYVVCRVLYL